MRRSIYLLALVACSNCSGPASDPAADEPASAIDVAALSGLGTVTNVRNLANCPSGAPPGATCRQVTVTGCPGIATEPIDAVVAIRSAMGTLRGTVVHFIGGGGEGFQGVNQGYEAAGFRNVYISWVSDWEQTQSSGIRTAACRPATILQWVFTEPTLHNSSRSLGFCGEGFSGGSGQLGYALAHYGMGSVLDYVNELSGPPFGRIDIGCNGDAPPTATVCGVADTTRLPGSLNAWENIQPPLTCGSHNVPATELARWKSDSIDIGGVYNYPQTQVQFFACTFQATAVTVMGNNYFNTIVQAEGSNPNLAQYHCYFQSDGCQGEGLGTGLSDAAHALISNCVPRHQ
ncbi:MAG TPA: hypothetical protein VF516_33890 [Kofleriaceae bacterium]